MSVIRLLLLATLVLSGVLSGFYVWGEWVAIAAIIAFAGRQTFWIRRESKQQPVAALRLVIVFAGSCMAGALAVLIGYVIGMVMHGHAPN